MRHQQVYDETCCSSRVKPAPAGSIERSDVVNPASRVSASLAGRSGLGPERGWLMAARVTAGSESETRLSCSRNPACLRRSGAISLSGNSCDLFQGKGTVVID